MRIFVLSAQESQQHWADVESLFAFFAQQVGDLTPERIKERARDETIQIWGVQDDQTVRAVVATEIAQTEGGLICVLRAAAGKAPVGTQKRLIDEIAKWARSIGCNRVRLYGRRGWLRRFPQFKQTGIVGDWDLETLH